jgi:hypothetical protein
MIRQAGPIASGRFRKTLAPIVAGAPLFRAILDPRTSLPRLAPAASRSNQYSASSNPAMMAQRWESWRTSRERWPVRGRSNTRQREFLYPPESQPMKRGVAAASKKPCLAIGVFSSSVGCGRSDRVTRERILKLPA